MDRAQRRVLAEAATSGPWRADDLSVLWDDPDDPNPYDVASATAEDAAFIAANNPAQFLADCDEHDALVAEVAGLDRELRISDGRAIHWRERAEAAEAAVERVRALALFDPEFQSVCNILLRALDGEVTST